MHCTVIYTTNKIYDFFKTGLVCLWVLVNPRLTLFDPPLELGTLWFLLAFLSPNAQRVNDFLVRHNVLG